MQDNIKYVPFFQYSVRIGVRNSTKTEKELVLKEGLVLLLGTVLRQRRISTIRGVELWEKGQVSEMEREREKERMMIRKIYVLCEGNIH